MNAEIDLPLVRWEKRSEWPLLALSLLFLAAYALPIVDPTVPESVTRVCETVVLVSWVLFGLDYGARLVIARRKWQFVRSNLLDLAVIVLPLLRPLRLLRLAVLLSVLNRAGSGSLRGRVAVYVTGGAVLLVVCAGLAITESERDQPDATIVSFADGLWWAVTTMTTVGYGDRYPVSGAGRVIAVALMLGGVALLGVVTASLASWMVERVAEINDTDQAATQVQVESLTVEIRELRAEIRLLSAGGGGGGGGAPVTRMGAAPQPDRP